MGRSRSRRAAVLAAPVLAAPVRVAAVLVAAVAAFAQASLPALAAEPDDLANRAFLFNEVGEFEEEINAPLGFVPNHHVQSLLFANENGRVLLLTLANFKLFAQVSTDAGVTYGTPLAVETARPVLQVVGYRSEDERVYVAYRFAGLTKDVGLRFRRSDDMGQSWTSPVDLVAEGDANHGIGTVSAIHANEAGRVAVAYQEYWEDNDTYVRVSSNFGAAWTAPVKPDLNTSPNRTSFNADVVVDQAGNVHCAYVQNRGSGTRIFYSRSTDGGLTFGGEQLLGGSVPTPGTQDGPDLDVTSQGRIVLAASDTRSGGSALIWNSVNAGASFTLVRDQTGLGAPGARAARVAASYATPTVLVGYRSNAGVLNTFRSADQGGTFAAPVNNTALTAADDYAIARTNSGTWLIAQQARDAASDPRRGTIQLKVSTDDGVTFGAPKQADHAGGPDQGPSGLTSLVATNSLDGALVAYLDTRSNNRAETFVNRSSGPSWAFADERKLGPYGNVDNFANYVGPLVLAPNDTDVHVLYRLVVDGPFPDAYYTRSTNAGNTYEAPIRLSQHVAGSEFVSQIALARRPLDNDSVYALWARVRYDAPPRTELAFRRSDDRGVTWGPEVVVGQVSDPRFLRMVVNASGHVFALYSAAGTDIKMIVSRDDGATWGAEVDFDQQATGATVINDQPVVCIPGSTTLMVVVWRTNLAGGTTQTIHARTSTDSGNTFTNAVNLRSTTATSANVPDVECAQSDAVAVWADFRDTTLTRAWSNRWSNAAWQGERQVTTAQTKNQFVPRVVYAFDTNSVLQPVVIYTDNNEVYTHRSTDFGTTWGAARRLDDLAPQPLAASRVPYLVSDFGSRLFAVWQDTSAGAPSIAARLSTDGGTTWDQPVVRMNSEPNQGSRFNQWLSQLEMPAAVHAGTLHVALTGYRSGGFFDTRMARWVTGGTDADGDGVPSTLDCNDGDPTVGRAPTEVLGLTVSRPSGATARLAWVSQDGTAGSGTSYDVVTGSVAALRTSGGFGGASCLVDDDADTPYDDTRPRPAAGAADYYLVRAEHACVGTYGNAGVTPDPRDALDAASPCP